MFLFIPSSKDMLRTDPAARFSAQHARSAMSEVMSNIPPESLQKQIDKPFDPPERREEIESALSEFAQGISQICC